MDEVLKKLLESELLTPETADELKASVSKMVEAARAAEAKKLSEKYDSDREKIMAAAEIMIREGLESELREFRESCKRVTALEARAAKAASAAKRVAEAKATAQVGLAVEAMRRQLKVELKEFRESRIADRKRMVDRVREINEAAEKRRADFIERGAIALESIIEKGLKGIYSQLRREIIEAKQNDFGRRLFEAFATEFKSTHFSESREIKKMRSAVREAREAAAKAKDRASRLERLAESKVGQVKRLTESVERTKIMGALLGKLSGDARESMKTLLESVPTERLRERFKKYLPEVTKSGGRSRALFERRTVDRGSLELRRGDAKTADAISSDVDKDIERLKAAAGLS